MRIGRFWILFSLMLTAACQTDHKTDDKEKHANEPLFTLLKNKETGIQFSNHISDTREFNYLFYQYMYNGGGVGAGDINNDGLIDLYFTGNQVSNKLYLNKGDFLFEDITKSAGVACSGQWSNGISMVDVNADGWLDLYVSASASLANDEARRNKLFINNRDNTFTEQAEKWGIDDPAYSNQAYFLDYDQDGDLDMYLLNHRIDFKDNLKTEESIERNFSPLHTDKLYRNDGSRFLDVTVESGILNHAWGLSCSVGDFNNDGWQDIYVCNDFVQPDYLYINQKDGTFKDEILKSMSHTSFYSMGSDFEDINNDGLADLFVADMVSENHERSIRNMAAMDEEEFHRLDEIGYGKQYMFNMLQLNQGNGEFTEIAQVAGVSKTDWSWAPLIADFDNDGHKDIFVSNGIKRDVTDIDYKEQVRLRAVQGNPMGPQEVFDSWPSESLKNYAFRNKGDLRFDDVSSNWGLGQKQNSNGAAYADLDGDGDLDLVLNNIDAKASIYRNNSRNNFVKFKLKPSAYSESSNIRVELKTSNLVQSAYFNPFRGYLSSLPLEVTFGLGQNENIEEALLFINDQNPVLLENTGVNEIIEIDFFPGEYTVRTSTESNLIVEVEDIFGFVHRENTFDDLEREVLLPHKQSAYGGFTTVADFNGDGLSDFFVGNSLGNIPALFIQNENGAFTRDQEAFWNSQSKYEDQSCLATDIDSDGDMDLLVGSGAYELEMGDSRRYDRLYMNDGNGNFSMKEIPFNTNSSCIAHDGKGLVFIGGRTLPGEYPLASPSQLLSFSGDVFVSLGSELIEELGIVNDAQFFDYDEDGDSDLIVAGEWMPITIILNEEGQYTSKIEIPNSAGWWNCIEKCDIDSDGDFDFILGNLGENNKYHPTSERPFHVYSNDFDDNGKSDIVLTKQKGDRLLPARGRECSSEQIPDIKRNFPTYTAFGKADVFGIYGQEKMDEAVHLQVQTFSTSVLLNDDGDFKLKRLPTEAQLGPTMSLVIEDVNKDGHSDIIGAGNIWDAEAETIRYDGNRGFTLLGDGKGNFKNVNSGFYYNSNARDLDKIVISGKNYLMLTSNNDRLRLFEIK
ncbi:MAG: VCBS repeat-containing protein [Bacteroidota bacterium]